MTVLIRVESGVDQSSCFSAKSNLKKIWYQRVYQVSKLGLLKRFHIEEGYSVEKD